MSLCFSIQVQFRFLGIFLLWPTSIPHHLISFSLFWFEESLFQGEYIQAIYHEFRCLMPKLSMLWISMSDWYLQFDWANLFVISKIICRNNPPPDALINLLHKFDKASKLDSNTREKTVKLFKVCSYKKTYFCLQGYIHLHSHSWLCIFHPTCLAILVSNAILLCYIQKINLEQQFLSGVTLHCDSVSFMFISKPKRNPGKV